MRIKLPILLTIILVMPSCYTYGSGDYPPNGMVGEERLFTISNGKGGKLFDVKPPIGQWGWWDTTKWETGTRHFEFMYKGPNSGMINAEIRIMYLDSAAPDRRTIEEERNRTTIADLNKSMAHLLDKNNRNNLQDFYKPKNLVHGIRNIAGIHCRYFSITNHSGPTLDTPTAELRGLGSGRKEEEYFCPVMRDGKFWFLGVDIVYSLSDVAIQRGMNIDFYEMIKDFDVMLKPTLESLKLYGELKQY